jgi:hypothetical protein
MNDAEFIKKFGLGRRTSPFDARDYRLASFMPMFAGNDFIAPDTNWELPTAPLNQKDTPHCGGFSIATWGNTLPVQDNFVDQDGHDFYYKAKIFDSEPGQENGTCERSVAKVLKQERLIDAYAFASSVPEAKWWLVNKGPLLVGSYWTRGLFTPDSNNIVHITGEVVGGHAYVINQIKNNDLLGIQCAWGENWGVHGKAYIPISEFAVLFRQEGEIIATTELPSRALQSNSGFNFWVWLKAFLEMFKAR